MEIIEHVENVDYFLKSCSNLLNKDGIMFVATLNKTLKSYIFAIIGAEYIMRWLPIGTHSWEKFVKPEYLKDVCKKNSLELKKSKKAFSNITCFHLNSLFAYIFLNFLRNEKHQ